MFTTTSLPVHCGKSYRRSNHRVECGGLRISSVSTQRSEDPTGVHQGISSRPYQRHYSFRRVVKALLACLVTGLFVTCHAGQFDDVDWCQRSPGVVYYTDPLGRRHPADISYTRDGSVWFRFTPEVPSDWAAEWTYADETQFQLKLDVVEPSVYSLLQSVTTQNGGTENQLNYTDYCALTDLQVVLRADRGWHPSYLTAFDPRSRETKTFVFRHNRDCDMSTRLRLDVDGQRLVCDGGSGPRTACGRSGLPERGRSTGPLLLRTVNFDPMGPDRLLCNTSMTSAVGSSVGGAAWTGDDTFEGEHIHQQHQQQQQPYRSPPPSSYTFQGTYYTVFVKVAHCVRPRDAPSIGYEVTNRPNRDDNVNTIILTDPTQTILADSTIIGWRIFVKVHSVKHNIFLQVWRPVLHAAPVVPTSHVSRHAFASGTRTPTQRRPSPSVYTLVGQTFVGHERTHLRAVDVPLTDLGQQIRVHKGDVLGLYYPDQNPIGWTSVPCADYDAQRYRAVVNPSNVAVNRTMRFDPAPPDDRSPCRHYSFVAMFANKSGVKHVDDWSCPPRDRQFSTGTIADKEGGGLRGWSSASSQVPDSPARSPLLRKIKDTDKVDSDYEFGGVGDDSIGGQLAINLLLITVGGLMSMLLVVGVVSYCRAVDGS